MFKKNRISLLLVTVLVMTLSLGLAAFSPVSAENASGPGGPGGPGGQGGRGRGVGNGAYLAEALGITEDELTAAFEEARADSNGQNFEETLAAALGISVEALETARGEAQAAALAQALANGNITQEEYDAFMARQAFRDYLERDEIIAGALGLSAAELQTAFDEGKRIPDLLDEQGISQEDFQAAVQAAHDEALAQAVSDGVITQEQADQISQGGFGGPGSPGGRDGKGGPANKDGQRRPGGPGNQNQDEGAAPGNG